MAECCEFFHTDFSNPQGASAAQNLRKQPSQKAILKNFAFLQLLIKSLCWQKATIPLYKHIQKCDLKFEDKKGPTGGPKQQPPQEI